MVCALLKSASLRGLALTVLLTVSAPAPSQAEVSGISWGGHLKSINLHLQAPPLAVTGSGEISSNSLRLDLSAPVGKRGDVDFSVEDIFRYLDPPGLLGLPGDSPNRRIDLEKRWNDGGRYSHLLQIDRLALRGTAFGLEWSLGRQAVGFGRISLFSPLDIIAPFPPDALDTEVRPGVDSVRLSRYFGINGEAGMTAIFGQEQDLNSYLATVENNVRNIDLLAIAGWLRNRPMAGLGFAADISGMGFKVEATHFEGTDVGKTGGDIHHRFAIAAAEIDYRFENDLVLFAQYFYNGAGVSEPEDFPGAALSAPYLEGLSFLAGRHYLLAAPSYQLHPLVTASGLVIWNLGDDSFLLRPLVDISLSDNASLQLFWSVNRGKKPKSLPLFPIPKIRSEFGSAADSGGLFLKYFF